MLKKNCGFYKCNPLFCILWLFFLYGCGENQSAKELLHADSGICETPGLQKCPDKSLPVYLQAVSAQQKVFYTDKMTRKKQSTEISLALARNEYEAVQLILFSEKPVSSLQIEVTDLHKHGSEAVLSAQTAIEINPVSYVSLKTPRFSRSPAGWYPDPLLANQKIDLQAEVLQPVLVTVYAAPTLPAGEYYGSVLIKDQTGRSKTWPFKVLIWDFTLPVTSRFKTTVLADWPVFDSMWPVSMGYAELSDNKRHALMLQLAELGFRNRLAPTAYLANGLYSWNRDGQGETRAAYPTHDQGQFNEQRTGEMIDYMLAKGANNFFVALTANIYLIESKARQRETVLRTYLQDYARYLEKRGLGHMAYVYGVDEPWDEQVPQAKAIYRLVKACCPSAMRFMQNTNQNNSRIIGELLGYFDTLDINLGWFDVTKAARYRRKHPQALADFWWNINLWPDSRPNLLLEYPLVDARVVGLLSYAYQMQGFEYWQAFFKPGIGNYYPLPAQELRVDWQVDHRSLDGTLVYPGEDYKIYSSLRYESFRDGMEDLEYLYLLEALAPGHRLLRVPIVKGLSHYAKEPEDFMAFRAQLARAIIVNSRMQVKNP